MSKKSESKTKSQNNLFFFFLQCASGEGQLGGLPAAGGAGGPSGQRDRVESAVQAPRVPGERGREDRGGEVQRRRPRPRRGREREGQGKPEGEGQGQSQLHRRQQVGMPGGHASAFVSVFGNVCLAPCRPSQVCLSLSLFI